MHDNCMIKTMIHLHLKLLIIITILEIKKNILDVPMMKIERILNGYLKLQLYNV